MNPSQVEEKQQRIRATLNRLAQAQTPQVGVRLFARSPGETALRGLLNPAPGPRPTNETTSPLLGGPQNPGGAHGLPALFARPAHGISPAQANAIRIGEELHVVIDAPRSGFLHVFNLGTSGEAKKLIPEPGRSVAVEAGRAYLASPGGGSTPFISSGPRGEPWVEHGPANGFPERILAVVTADNRAVAASTVHPAWGDAAYARGIAPSGFGAPSVEELLSAWPPSTWAWGYTEIPVE